MDKINYTNIYFPDLQVQVDVSEYTSNNATDEYHFMIKPQSQGGFSQQAMNLIIAWKRVLDKYNLSMDSLMVRRIFTSDLVNQYAELKNIFLSEEKELSATAIIEQPPLPMSKLAMWAYHAVDAENDILKEKKEKHLTIKHNAYEHIWTTDLVDSSVESSYEQTDSIFKDYVNEVESRGLSLKDDVVRTWIYVQNVDANYAGVVVSRREYFEAKDLTIDTNYITSTGIEGRNNNPKVKTTMDALAIKGLEKGQVQFLNALEYLNHTHEYGVTFERGTTIEYGDRKHIYISGTASIDKKGEVIHLGDVYMQMQRAIDNIEALLADTNAQLSDLAQIIVYLRDPSDFNIVDKYLINRFKGLPYVIVLAPVCRPAWLIEIEGIAIMTNENDKFKKY